MNAYTKHYNDKPLEIIMRNNEIVEIKNEGDDHMYTVPDKMIAYMKDCVLHSLPHEPVGIHQRDISRNTGFNARDVRYIIQRLRDDGYAICGTPADGYWIAQTSFELNDTIAKMRSHIEQVTATLDVLISTQKRLEIKEGLR